MISFHRAALCHKEQYEKLLSAEPERGCEYAFANLFMWGKQEIAFLHGCVVFFSHFGGRSVYPFPIGPGDKRAALEAILEDAGQRGIPCRITGMTPADRDTLESWFPGVFQFRISRDNFDYVYTVEDLADLRGRKFQSKRNHFNRFCTENPDHQVIPMTPDLLPQIKEFVENWFARRQESDPLGDYFLENLALNRAFLHWETLELEGIVLMNGGKILAVSIGSRLSSDAFDVHFEKAQEDVPGAYTAVNCHFARYLRMKHPELRFLNREDDVGLEGLRKAKLSYRPHHMIEKYWAYVQEAIHED